ncbi:MAG: transposase, partial [Candidatus Njordarchaeia archaeon]
DLTDELYWGKKTKYVKKTKPRNGTSKAFKFLVGSIVSRYGKFIVYVRLITEDSDLVSEVKRAILHIEKVVKIGLILMDRGFVSVKMIRMLLGLKYRFIMPLRMTGGLKKAAEKIKKSAVFRLKMVSRKYGSVTFWAVARIDDKKKPVFYAVLDKNMVRKSSDIHYAYSGKRWRIEINNKMVKLYKAKTSSPDPRVRYFLFAFSCIIYNTWLLSSFNMVKTAKKKLNTPLHYKYYSVWTALVAFHTTLSLL